MIVTLVVAAANNNAIGKDNKLLWHMPNDMKYFKNVTWGMPVVMGRKTFEALGKALRGRKNIVLTQQAGWKAEEVVAVKTFEDAKFLVKQMDMKEMMTMDNGTKVMPDGNYTTADGNTMKLKNGECIMKDGSKTTMDKMPM